MMAKYTVELRELIENGVDIFNFDYPIFDETHRSELEKKIINHYYFREIGFETTGRFIHYLKTTMNEIMPKMNRLYKTLSDHDIQVYQNMKLENDEQLTGKVTTAGDSENSSTTINDTDRTNNETTVLDRDTSNTNVVDRDATVDRDTTNQNTNVIDSDGTNTKTNERLFSDTPQGRTTLTDTQFATDLTTTTDSETSAIDTTTTDNGSGTEDVISTEDVTTTDSGSEDVTNTVTGSDTEDTTTTVNETGADSRITDSTNVKTGGQSGYSNATESELFEIYAKLNTNVDNMIIVELAPLFMQIY